MKRGGGSYKELETKVEGITYHDAAYMSDGETMSKTTDITPRYIINNVAYSSQ